MYTYDPTIYLSVGHCPTKFGAQNRTLRIREHTHVCKVRKHLETMCRPGKTKLVPVCSLRNKVSFINKQAEKGDVAVDLHFNAFRPNRAEGLEVLYYPGSAKGLSLAEHVHDSLVEYLPFKARGIHTRGDLYFITHTKIPAIIVEPLFIDNDLEASYLTYKNGHKVIARAINQGIAMFIARVNLDHGQ